MKLSEDYVLRDIAGETIVVHQGNGQTDLTRIISLNASAKFLWESLAGKEFGVEDAANLLAGHYGIDPEQSLHDAGLWVEKLKGCGVIKA